VQFLAPIGLLALAGLIVPLIIHLWNVKQGKTLKVGSISLMGESDLASSKSFKLNDWLLFFFRCLLVILLALFLAQPYLKKMVIRSNKSGWVLVDGVKLSKAYAENRRTIDSLLKLGYELHDFNLGFSPLSLKDTADTELKAHSKGLSYTSLLHQVNQLVPLGSSVYLYADHRLSNFGNGLPKINYRLKWKPLNQTDTSSSWISDYAGKKYEGKSSPSHTSYQAINNVDVVPIAVAIHETGVNTDRKYLIAALRAIASFSNRRIIINPPTGKVTIGFWLTDEPVALGFKAKLAPNGTLFQYEKGKVVSAQSFMDIHGTSIKLSKCIASPLTNEKIWSDGLGHPVLTQETFRGLKVFHFYSRFNPKWNELVWNEVFVKALMPIVIKNEEPDQFGFENHPADQRRLSGDQNEVIEIHQTGTSNKSTQNEEIDIHFWIAALFIFITERILSFRKSGQIYGKN
jgi:hypothetical protein